MDLARLPTRCCPKCRVKFRFGLQPSRNVCKFEEENQRLRAALKHAEGERDTLLRTVRAEQRAKNGAEKEEKRKKAEKEAREKEAAEETEKKRRERRLEKARERDEKRREAKRALKSLEEWRAAGRKGKYVKAVLKAEKKRDRTL